MGRVSGAVRMFARRIGAMVCAGLAACAHVPATAPSIDAAARAQREAEVAAVLDAWHEAAARADADAYFERIAPTGVFLGTDPDERWDCAQFRAAYGGHFARGKAWTFRAFARHVTIADDGGSAWFDERLRSESYGELRGTGVVVRARDEGRGAWRVMLYDLTIPIPNDLAAEVVARIRARAAPAPDP